MFSTWNTNSAQIKNNVNEEFADDWNHEIYLYNISVDTNSKVENMNICEDEWTGKVKIDFEKLVFPLDTTCRYFQKLKIKGNNPNIDIVLEAC
jgi:hypothetical protein